VPAFKTRTERLRRTITDLVDWCRSHRYQSVEEQRAALARRLVGHYNYSARWSPTTTSRGRSSTAS
jgi:hypothetical protein